MDFRDTQEPLVIDFCRLPVTAQVLVGVAA